MASFVTKTQDLASNTQGQIFGTSKFIQPNPAGFVAEAKFGSSCRLCPCSCCPSCPDCFECGCVSDEVEKRSYARVYENRLEINYAWTYLAWCCCCSCSTKACVSDNVAVFYFDMPPTSAWGAPFPFCFTNCTCCGRPGMAVYTPKCCGCKCERCGQTVFGGPCTIKCCCGLCGDSCFPCAIPLLTDVQEGDKFLSAVKKAYESYAEKRNIPKLEQARFYAATDGCCGFKIHELTDDQWDESLAHHLVELQVMDRDDEPRLVKKKSKKKKKKKKKSTKSKTTDEEADAFVEESSASEDPEVMM